MKKASYILILSVLILFLQSCGSKSTLGNWTDKDKELFKESLLLEYKENKIIQVVFGDKYDDFIECNIQKAEQKYTSLDEALKDDEGMEKVSEECGAEIAAVMLEEY